MKKIGILFGQENTYPQAFVDRVNAKKPEGIVAEWVRIDKVIQAATDAYAVIIDRISQDIPFYRAYLKNAALSGTAVINNPFWWTADDKFFNNGLAEKIGVAVPRSVLLPANEHPPNTDSNSMRNLAYPLDWQSIFDYVGFPAYLKPYSGGGWKNVYRVRDAGEFYDVYNQTGDLVMMLQEEIIFSDYFRCYCIDRKDVRMMPYEPRNPAHLRYVTEPSPEAVDLMDEMEATVLQLNRALGYDFNTVELAIREGVPYAIDFCNPAPDADYYTVQQDNFEWVVEATANMAIRRARAHREGRNNLTWGEFITSFVKDE
jgi:glutathione synthase/RimK-type ligase-like ATP-grasp enzyme